MQGFKFDMSERRANESRMGIFLDVSKQPIEALIQAASNPNDAGRLLAGQLVNSRA